MRILLFHQHLAMPDQPGSSRWSTILEGLASVGDTITVITGSNIRDSRLLKFKEMGRYSSAFLGNIEFRSAGVAYSGGMESSERITSFIQFAVQACFMWDWRKKPDLVVASSTPLTITVPAILVAALTRVPFVFEVRDVWPDAPIQLGILKNRVIITLANMLAMTAYRRANRIVALTEGIRRRIISKSI